MCRRSQRPDATGLDGHGDKPRNESAIPSSMLGASRLQEWRGGEGGQFREDYNSIHEFKAFGSSREARGFTAALTAGFAGVF